MKRYLLLIAAAAISLCSCVSQHFCGTFIINNFSDVELHLESSFNSADGNAIHSMDLEANHGNCVLCKSADYSSDRDFSFEDIVTNPSEGRITISHDGEVVLEWTADKQEYLIKGMFSSFSSKGISRKMTTGVSFSLDIFTDYETGELYFSESPTTVVY